MKRYIKRFNIHKISSILSNFGNSMAGFMLPNQCIQLPKRSFFEYYFCDNDKPTIFNPQESLREAYNHGSLCKTTYYRFWKQNSNWIKIIILCVVFLLFIAWKRVQKKKFDREKSIAKFMDDSFLKPLFNLYLHYIYRKYPLDFQNEKHIQQKIKEVHEREHKVLSFEEFFKKCFKDKEKLSRISKFMLNKSDESVLCDEWNSLLGALVEQAIVEEADKMAIGDGFEKGSKEYLEEFDRNFILKVFLGYKEFTSKVEEMCPNMNKKERKLVSSVFDMVHHCSGFFVQLSSKQMNLLFTNKKVRKLEKKNLQKLIKKSSRFKKLKKVWAFVLDPNIQEVRRTVEDLQVNVKRLNYMFDNLQENVESLKTESPYWFFILDKCRRDYDELLNLIHIHWDETSKSKASKILEEVNEVIGNLGLVSFFARLIC